MTTPVLSTFKILMNKSLNNDIDETWVDWAIEMIEAGNEFESLYILAGILKPYNQFELQELTIKVLKELNLDFSDKDLVIRNYVYFSISNSLFKPETYTRTLRELKDICQSLNLHPLLMDFYNLYFAKDDLIQSENQWYWEGANRENIDKIITLYFSNWKMEYEVDNKIITK